MTDLCIPFTQYLRPDGRPKSIVIERPEPVAEKAKRILDAGFRFECEVLSTGDVSFAVSDDDGDHAFEICRNGPDVLAAVDRLILGFDPVKAASQH
jgi:hypothetical protein